MRLKKLEDGDNMTKQTFIYQDDSYSDYEGWDWECFNCISHHMNGSAYCLWDVYLQVYMFVVLGTTTYEDVPDEVLEMDTGELQRRLDGIADIQIIYG